MAGTWILFPGERVKEVVADNLLLQNIQMMSPKKPSRYFDSDYGRPGNHQVHCENDCQRMHLRASSNSHACPELSNQAANIKPFGTSTENLLDNRVKYPDSWELSDMIQGQVNSHYTHSPLSMGMTNEDMITLGVFSTQAHLILKTPPEQRFRYRYDTEMSGTHGSLQGIKLGSEKNAPEVELANFPGEALIRVSLVTCNEMGERYPHPHNLFIKEKMYQKKIYENLHNKPITKTGHYSDPHYIRVGINGVDYVARFEGMCIISSKKENFSASIKEKLQIRDVEQGLKARNVDEILKKVDDAVKLVDLDFVSLCFEAFHEDEGRLIPICPPLYSEPIGNAKSANTGKLKISRINKCSGSSKGGDEIWLLVEKTNKKGLIIRFFEEFDGKVSWESCLKGDDIILHHQYAIIFKTPPYRDPDISSEVKVLMRLERSSQLSQTCDFSDTITFVYEPFKNRNYRNENIYKKESILSPSKQTHVKRPRTESSLVQAINFQYKRKKDELDAANMILDDEEFDNMLSDNGFDFAQLDQFTGLNLEDFLQFFPDESELALQKDGISTTIKSRRDLIQLLQLIHSKYDENEVRKLTDRFSNIQFSKGKSKPEKSEKAEKVEKVEKPERGSEEEKKDVEDAVSTLLSFRERTVDITRFKNKVEKDDCDS